MRRACPRARTHTHRYLYTETNAWPAGGGAFLPSAATAALLAAAVYLQRADLAKLLDLSARL